MTASLTLDFHGTRFTVPKPSLFYLFEHQPDLFNATSYEVQSSVPLGVFEVFVESLKTGTRVAITKENASAISLLAKEFWVEDLLAECSALQMASTPELLAALSDRISKLERQMSSQPLTIAELKESIANHDRQIESLGCRISELEHNHKTELKELKSLIAAPTPVLPVSPSKPVKAVGFPLHELKSVRGIICYLTRKHGGNVHDKGVVTITSQSVYDGTVSNTADLTNDDSCFQSGNEPDQWVCWDFHEMRVRPTHYTIRSILLKSWVFEGSLDFVNWTEIDRKRKNKDFKARDWVTASFVVAKSVECRFIRLTQTGQAYDGDDHLLIQAVEFFGTLLE
jgi:uncharacterized coiled-coil protein SlyX